MAFKFVGNVKPGPNPLNRLRLPVKSGTTISLGELVKVVNGAFDTATSNAVFAGVCVTEGDTVGVAGLTTFIEAQILGPGDLLEAPQPAAITDLNAQVGDTCDIASGALAIGASSNADFIIWKADLENNILTVLPQKRQFCN